MKQKHTKYTTINTKCTVKACYDIFWKKQSNASFNAVGNRFHAAATENVLPLILGYVSSLCTISQSKHVSQFNRHSCSCAAE